MLGQVLRIRGSSFRMVPNPTSDQWGKLVGNKPSWTIARLLKVFQVKVKDLAEQEGLFPEHKIRHMLGYMEKIFELGCEDEATLGIQCREAIHDSLDVVDIYLLSLKQAEVLNVLVAHLTKVVDILDDAGSLLNTIVQFSGVLADKEESFLGYYFKELLPAVIQNLESNKKLQPLSNERKGQWTTIWISLMFRMLCWLLLHDFDTADVKIVPSNLKGSRMPIFIG